MVDEVSYKEIVLSLFDRGYHYGCAALANSLVEAKFEGLLFIGYRGKLPPWTDQLEAIDEDHFYLTKKIVIRFREVLSIMNMGYYKPYILKEAIDIYPNTQKFYFFDADIMVKAPWSLYSSWLEKGVCLCLDNAFHFLPFSHPWRKAWRKVANVADDRLNCTNHYFNSGFIGIERGSSALIDRWIYFTEKYISMGGNIDSFSKETYSSFKGDQDLLNAAITISSDIGINEMGTEGMGFTLPATMMIHAIGETKPWNKIFLKKLIKIGHRPNYAEKVYFTHCKYPIRIFSPFTFRLKKLDLLISSFLGRFIG